MRQTLAELETPRFEDGESLLLAGLTARYNAQSVAGIPAQWQRFGPHIGRIPHQVGTTTYGACFNMNGTGEFDYLCGVEVSDTAALPPELDRLAIPQQRYAVFFHRNHISTIRETWNVPGHWAVASGHILANGPPQLEIYGEEFDPRTGMGGVEIRIPVAS